MTLIGTDGGAEIDRGETGYEVTLNKVLADRMITSAPDAPRPGADDFTALGTRETKQWLEAVRDGHDALVLPEQACTVTEVLEAVYASAQSGQTITF